MEAMGGHLPNKHIDRVMFVNTAAAGKVWTLDSEAQDL